MGEFAIGTNTTAYAMARKFDITQLMPILIMEKTGRILPLAIPATAIVKIIRYIIQTARKLLPVRMRSHA